MNGRSPAGDGPPLEVPLVGGDRTGGDRTEPSPAGRRAPNRRRVAGWSALAAAIGVVAAVVLLSVDDDGGPPTETTWAADELASVIAVPPTLTPVTITPATGPPGSFPSTPGVPTDKSIADLAAVAASVGTLPQRLGVDPAAITGFQLSDGSLAALDAPRARRSVTEYVVGVDGFEQIVTITNDPATGRYLFELDSGGGAVPAFVVDLVGGFTHAETAPGEWASIPNDEVAEGAGVSDMATFVRHLQLGPIRSDTRDAWELVQAGPLVESPGEGLREYVVVLGAAAVPEWARYALGPSGEAEPLPGNTLVGYAVYVADDGSIRRVSGSTEFGATSQRVVHRIEELDVPPVIELPAVSTTTSMP